MASDEHPRVLLVEDEFLLCDMIAEVLAEHGFEVHAVPNAKEALRHLTCGSPCDILLTDIQSRGQHRWRGTGQAGAGAAAEAAGGLCLRVVQPVGGTGRGGGLAVRAEAVQP